MALLLSMFTTQAQAQLTNIQFYTSTSNGQITITGFYATGSGPLVIPASLNGLPVTSIGTDPAGTGPFEYNTNLTSVTIPDSVTLIGEEAFGGCTGLTSVALGNGLVKIGFGAFAGCTGLTSVAIPNSVTSMGEEAFEACTNLTSVSLPNGITDLGYNTFSYSGLTSVTIPTSVTYLDAAFENCAQLTSVTIPNSVTSIAYEEFLGCQSLTSVTIPSSVTAISNNPFGGCTALTAINVSPQNSSFSSVDGVLFNQTQTQVIQYPAAKPDSSYTIPTSVTGFYYEAFANCVALTSVTIPNSVTSIASGTFSNCSALTNVVLGIGVTDIGENAFSGCTSLTSIAFPNSLTTIEDNAFSGSGLNSVTIPSNMTFIGPSAFEGCAQLTSVTIPNGVTEIGDFAFSGTGLTSVTIPASVNYIDFEAFYECPMTSATFLGNAPTMGQYALQSDSPSGFTAYYYEGATGFTSPTWVYNETFAFEEYQISSCAAADNGITLPSLFTTTTNNGQITITGYTGSLGTVSIPPTINGLPVTGIAASAFSGNTNLTSVTIPSSITDVGQDAFSGCTGLTSAIFQGSAPTTGSGIFLNVASGFDVSYVYNAPGFSSPWTDSANDVYPATTHGNVSQWASFYNAPLAATPLNDGVPNLLKYLYDIKPSAPMTETDRAALPVVGATTVNSTPCLTLSYRKNLVATGITVNVQTSSDLQTWTTLTPTTGTPTSTTYALQQTGTDPATGDPLMQVQVPASGTNQFFRLNVTSP